ncbi:MAG: hypothetical protein WCG85_28585 [Polyangia bacterium]
MFKMSTCGLGLLLAGLVGLACSGSGLKSRAGDGAAGGQAGSTVSNGTTGGSTASGGTTAQGGSTASGGGTATGGNGGMAGAGGASSSSSGASCLDSSGTIATTAKTCTLASDCKQVVQPTCCGSISEVGLAKSSSCTFPTPSCENFACPIYLYPPEQAEDGKDAAQGGSIGVECVSGQCMTFVMPGSADAAAADATGGATGAGGSTSSGGSSASGGSGGKGGTSGSGGMSSTGAPDASADKPLASVGTPCSSQDDCEPYSGMMLACNAPGESSSCGICEETGCANDADCVHDGGSTAGTMICSPVANAGCVCFGTKACALGCRINLDCGPGQGCNPFNSCQKTCVAGDGTCPVNYSCDASGFCQQKLCTSDSECSGFCVNGVCYGVRGTCEPIPG